MIVESKGIKCGNYFIPPFKLEEGALIVINLNGGGHFYDLMKELVTIFTGKITNENVIIYQQLYYVNKVEESIFRRIFNPVRIAEYLNKNANNKNSNKIYSYDNIFPKTKVNRLNSKQKKLLTLYATLSKRRDIIFNIAELGTQDALEVFNIVKDSIQNAGSAIFLDWTDEMKDDCTQYIVVEKLTNL